MRLLLLLIVALAGCQATDYRPFAAAVMGHVRQTDTPPPPSGCPGGGDCDGKGYLGDCTVKVDCPACDIWQGIKPNTEPAAASPASEPDTPTQSRRIRLFKRRR